MNEAKAETTTAESKATAESKVPPEPSGPAEAARHLRHEMRTPLNQILGYSEMLLEEVGDDQSALATDLTRIRAAGQHLLSLVETHIREPAEGASDAWNAARQNNSFDASAVAAPPSDTRVQLTNVALTGDAATSDAAASDATASGQKFARRRSDAWRHEYSYGAEEADERPSREAGTLGCR